MRTKSFEFAVSIAQCCRELVEQKEYVLSKQLLRSGTSVGANVREATNSNSRRDFGYRMSISLRECDEAMFWLELLNASGYLPDEKFYKLHNDAQEIMRLLTAIIKTVHASLN